MMTPQHPSHCYMIAVITALATAIGTQFVTGIATGNFTHAFRRELVDLGLYWLVALPLCYLVAGMLGYLVPVRTWRWSLTMIAIQFVYMVLSAGSGPSLLPFALVMLVVIALPGILTGWLGGLIRRRRAPGNL